MNQEELIKKLQSEEGLTAEDLEAINNSKDALAESLKMSIDSYAQGQEILEALNGDNAPEEAEEDIEDIITTPMEDYTDEEINEEEE